MKGEVRAARLLVQKCGRADGGGWALEMVLAAVKRGWKRLG